MAWKLRKDKFQTDAAKEETGEADAGEEKGPEETTSSPFSFNDSAVEELKFAPDVPETAPTSFAALDLTHESHGHDTPEEPHFSSAEPSLAEPTFTKTAHAEAPDVSLNPPFSDDPVPFNPFIPYQPEEPQPASFAVLDREELAPGLASQNEEDDLPRVAPFIVDVSPIVEEAAPNGALVIRIGNLSANFLITKDVTTIGRPDSATQSYPDIEIELDDAVSRRHAEIRHRAGEYFLVDLMSTNGTLLNGQKVEGGQEQLLLHGDRIRMGDRTEIVFE